MYLYKINHINGVMVSLNCGRSWVHAMVMSNQRLKNGTGICCFSARHAVLRGKNKDWFIRNHDNVSDWSDISTRKLLF